MKAKLLVACGLAIAFSPTWVPEAWRPDVGIDGPPASVVWNTLAVALLLAFVLLVERRPLRSIRLERPVEKDLEAAGILLGVHLGWSWLAMTLWPRYEPDDGTATLTALPVLTVVVLIVSVAVCEEVLYRGYPIEHLTELTGRTWVAVALTAPVFVAPHLVFFGPEWLLYSGSGTAVLYVLYVWRRNLPASMLLHLGVNAPILVPTLAG